MENILKILMVEYLSNHVLDLPHTTNLRLGDLTQIKSACNEDDLQWKMTSKYK